MPGFLQGFLFAVWLAYIIFKDVGVPLVNKFTHKRPEEKVQQECPLLQPVVARVTSLEIAAGKQSERVVDLSDMLREHASSTSRTFDVTENKLDMILAELKEFREANEGQFRQLGERVKGTEVHVEHLLKSRRGGQS